MKRRALKESTVSVSRVINGNNNDSEMHPVKVPLGRDGVWEMCGGGNLCRSQNDLVHWVLVADITHDILTTYALGSPDPDIPLYVVQDKFWKTIEKL
jgi:hypothetical protein